MPDKFEKFTTRARRVLTLAQEEAAEFNHNYIGTEHLLLGLVRESDGVAARVLETLGVQLSQIRSAVEYVIGRGESAVAGERELTARAKRVLELAIDEARDLQHQYIGTEHLLLGLLREGEGVAAGILEGLGVGLPQVRTEVVQLLGANRGGLARSVRSRVFAAFSGGRGEPSGAKGNVVTCRVDDLDLAAIDALVEAGIRSTRSDAASWLIRAGVEANVELFDKVNATLEEIRRLRTEAQVIAQHHVTGRAATTLAEPLPAPGAVAGPATATETETA